MVHSLFFSFGFTKKMDLSTLCGYNSMYIQISYTGEFLNILTGLSIQVKTRQWDKGEFCGQDNATLKCYQ